MIEYDVIRQDILWYKMKRTIINIMVNNTRQDFCTCNDGIDPESRTLRQTRKSYL